MVEIETWGWSGRYGRIRPEGFGEKLPPGAREGNQYSTSHVNGPVVDFYAFLQRLDGRCAATHAVKFSYRRRKAKNRYSARLKIKISVKEMQR
jgi:hypothetical protein